MKLQTYLSRMSMLLTCLVMTVLGSTSAFGAKGVEQPKWGKKTGKAIFTMKTFDKEGLLIGSTTGFFISEEGEAVTRYEPLRGAWRAVVIDAQGKEWPVKELLGANETYDAAHLRVDIKKSIALPIDSTSMDALVWMQPYMEAKRLQPMRVRRIERVQNGHQYLSLAPAVSGDNGGAPLLDAEGRAVAILQPTTLDGDTLCYAVSAAMAAGLQMTGLSINDPALSATHIKKALPATADQALLTLYVAGAKMDSTEYAAFVEDFISAFPAEPEGYMIRARALAAQQRWDEAEAQLVNAEKVVEDKPDQKTFTHHNCLRLRTDMLMQQAKWSEAIEMLRSLSQGPLRSAEVFLQAAACHAQLRDTLSQLAMLDSAVAIQPRPYLREAAPILLTRAQVRMAAKKWRPAVADLNDYEQLMAQQVNDHFYYLRYQAEVEGHLYQQAINDIKRAAELKPDDALYPAEEAWLDIRVSLWDEAVQAAQRAIDLDANSSDGWLFRGIALCQKDNKKDGIASLQKALDLGNAQAAAMIEKYK